MFGGRAQNTNTLGDALCRAAASIAPPAFCGGGNFREGKKRKLPGIYAPHGAKWSRLFRGDCP
jgi:hypothetical protein